MYDLEKNIEEINSSRDKLLKNLEKKIKVYEKEINRKKKLEEKQLLKLKEKIKDEKFKKLYKSNNKPVENVVEILRGSNLEVLESIDVLKRLNKISDDEIKKYHTEKNKLLQEFVYKARKSNILYNDVDKLLVYLDYIL